MRLADHPIEDLEAELVRRRRAHREADARTELLAALNHPHTVVVVVGPAGKSRITTDSPLHAPLITAMRAAVQP